MTPRINTTAKLKKYVLKSGDILLFYPGSIQGRISAWFTGSKYSHAAMAAIEDGTPFCLEVREFYGGRKVLLAEYRKNEPAKIDVYRINSDYIGDCTGRAVEEMEKYVGEEYGWRHAFNAVIRRVPLLNKMLDTKRECEKHPPFCSEAIARAYRNTGRDIVPQIADKDTLPGDLANSRLLNFIGELA